MGFLSIKRFKIQFIYYVKYLIAYEYSQTSFKYLRCILKAFTIKSVFPILVLRILSGLTWNDFSDTENRNPIFLTKFIENICCRKHD